jgi:hypothetical protein
MVEVNIVNFVTVGLMAALFWILMRFVLERIGAVK